MCLLVFSFQTSPRLSLIVGGNRDEFHSRAARPAAWWPDRPHVLAGRDLEGGGTWLGLGRNGRFATVTNYRDPATRVVNPRSRGLLVSEFLDSGSPAREYVEDVERDRYRGFNLVVWDGETLGYLTNRGSDPVLLEPGVYGLSNLALDAAWPKVERSKQKLARLIAEDSVNESTVLKLLDDRDPAPAGEVEAGDLPFSKALALSAPFVVTPEYGTRCSTVVTVDADGEVRFTERRFDAGGRATGESRYRFALSP